MNRLVLLPGRKVLDFATYLVDGLRPISDHPASRLSDMKPRVYRKLPLKA